MGSAGDLVRLLGAVDLIDGIELYRALGAQIRYAKSAPTGLERVQLRLEMRSSGGRI